MSSKAEVTGRIVELLKLVIASSVMTNERIARSMGINVVDLQALGFIARNGAPMTSARSWTVFASTSPFSSGIHAAAGSCIPSGPSIQNASAASPISKRPKTQRSN